MNATNTEAHTCSCMYVGQIEYISSVLSQLTEANLASQAALALRASASSHDSFSSPSMLFFTFACGPLACQRPHTIRGERGKKDPTTQRHRRRAAGSRGRRQMGPPTSAAGTIAQLFRLSNTGMCKTLVNWRGAPLSSGTTIAQRRPNRRHGAKSERIKHTFTQRWCPAGNTILKSPPVSACECSCTPQRSPLPRAQFPPSPTHRTP